MLVKEDVLDPSVKATAPQESDEALFLRYLRDRALPDLEVLIQRYQHFAFRVALCMCGNEALAEEAAQNAFIQLARSKADFNDQALGSFRAWLYRLVANAALNLKRTERRSTMRRTSERFKQEALAVYASREPTAAASDQREVRVALREALGSLDEDLRVPVVLHYVEGLSQTEIGKLAGVSVSQVSRRIAQGLDMLKRRLTAAGLAPAVMLPGLLSQRGLLDAPVGLQQALAQLVAHGPPPPLLVSRRASPPVTKSAAPVAAAAFTAVALAAMFAYFASRPEPVPKPKKNAEPPPAAVVAPEPPAPSPNLHLDFRKQPSDLPLLQGRWVWREGEGMETVSKLAVFAVLPDRVVQPPLEIVVTFHYRNEESGQLGAYYFQGNRMLSYRSWFGHRDTSDRGTTHTFRQIMAGRYAINYYLNEAMSMQEYETPNPSRHMGMGFRNMVVEEIRIRPLQDADLPKEFKDPLGVARALECEPTHSEPYRFQSDK